MRDVLTGWDAPGLDVDSPDAPERSDVISGRMTSISFGADSLDAGRRSRRAGSTSPTAMVHETEGGPGLFLALGGNVEIEQTLGDRWTFSVKVRADAGAAVLVGRTEAFQAGGPDGGDFAFSLGYAANPPDASPTVHRGLRQAFPSASSATPASTSASSPSPSRWPRRSAPRRS